MQYDLNIRPALAADISAMAAIRLAVQENVLSDPARITRSMYEDHLQRLGRTWVCEHNGIVIGFSAATAADNSIWALFVQPGFEGLGAGKHLLNAASAWLFAGGARVLSLSTTTNTRAERFYLAQGWERGEMKDEREVYFRLKSSSAKGVQLNAKHYPVAAH